EYGTTGGSRVRAAATSPSTIAASNDALSWAANSAAPASPPLPPLVDTSTIVRWVSRAANTRASSSSAAVPDSSARALGPAASRWARIATGAALVAPGRSAITVLSVRWPSIVCALKLRLRTVKPPPAVPPTPSRSRATCAASRRSPRLPGRLCGYSLASVFISANARAPSNASGASEEVSGCGREANDRAAIARAKGIGSKAARYRRPLSTSQKIVSAQPRRPPNTHPPSYIVRPRASARRSCQQVARRLHAHLRARADRRNPRAGGAAQGPPRGPHLGHGVRRGRVGDPVRARSADARRGARLRVAGDLRP